MATTLKLIESKEYPEGIVPVDESFAAGFLQMQELYPEFASDWYIVCKGYGESSGNTDYDEDEFTELTPEDLENVEEGLYWDYEIRRR